MVQDSHDGSEIVVRANAETTAAVLDALDGKVKREAIRVEDPPHAGEDGRADP